MNTRIDIFELTPRDLFRKLESDLTALESSGQDTYVAYNFFVTAEHLPDWLGMRNLVRQHGTLRIVSHIANGAKHRTLDDQRHHSVTGTEKFRYMEEGYIEPGYFYEPLRIHLSTDEARELRVPTIDADEERELRVPTIDAVSLGKRVVEFWRQYIPAG